MKRIAIYAVTIIGLGILSWGTGGCGGGGESSTFNPDVSLNADDFEGEFSLRDHSCSYDPISKFRITRLDATEFSLVVVNAGGSDVSNGDIFMGEFEGNGLYFTDTLHCTGVRMTSNAMATTSGDNFNLSIQKGDILAGCLDSASADESCFIAYQPD